jgi:hypothetical protein
LASGISIDWTYGEQGVYSWTVELRPTDFFPGFELPANQILPTAEENFAGILELANFTITIADGDYNLDGSYDCADADALVAAILNGSNKYEYDLTGDGLLDNSDMMQWLSNAGEAMLSADSSFLTGDADLNGVVDGADFVAWNANKFLPTASYCDGDFNTDGIVDGQDFVIWNAFKFQSSDTLAVPEPAGLCLLLLCSLNLIRKHRASLMR